MGTVFFILAVVLVLIFLVITHEAGHFIAAKLCGIKAEKFYVGFGPEIWGFDKGETRYGINWILAGGYVKICGMDPYEEIPEEDIPRSYREAPYWKRFAVVISGSLTHIVMAFLIVFAAYSIIGIPDYDRGSNVVEIVSQQIELDGVEITSPAASAGMEPGDEIVSMDGNRFDSWADTRLYIMENPGKEVEITVLREGSEVRLRTELAQYEEDGEAVGYLGISTGPYMEEPGVPTAFVRSCEWMGTVTGNVFYGIYRLFSLTTFKQLLGLSPPTIERPVSIVGISRIAGDLAERSVFDFLIFISVIMMFLSYINLLPLLPLDGGHILIIVYEKITKREVDLKKLYPVAYAVIFFFIILFVLTLRLDITNPIQLP